MTDEDKAKEVKNKFNYLKQKRNSWDSGIWQEIAEYVLPVRSDINTDRTPGKIQSTKIYDGTAVSALNLFADGLHGYMINPSVQWFTLRLPRQLRHLENIPEVRLFIEDAQHCLYSAFQNSNFYSEMRPYLKDGGSIGTASLYMEEDIATGKIVFMCLHPKEGFIAEDRFGNVDTFFRKVKLTARQAVQEFGKNKLSDSVINAFQSNPYTEFDFIHAVFPRTDYDDTKMVNTKKRFASFWVELSRDNILRESGYDYFPYRVWRYSKNSNEVYGYSPAAFALPEIKSLNSIAKDLLGAAQLTVRPPMNIPIEMMGKVRLTPNGMNYYGNDFNRRITPINTGINFPVALDREEKKREIIEKHFHVDFFLMLQRAERQMTATEIMEKMGEKASVLSASIGDLSTEIDGIIDNLWQIEFKAGRMPPVPDVLMQYGGANIDIVYLGPLAQAQKRLFETQGIKTGLELAVPLLAVFPDAVDLINSDEALKELLISNGFPQTALHSQEQIVKIRQGKSQQNAITNQKIDQERAAKMLKDLAQALKNAGGKDALDNILGDLTGQQQGQEQIPNG
jgi:hypothetical protein